MRDASDQVNVVLLTLDSFRADCFGSGLTPRLNHLAESAAVFTQAMAQGPYTCMSVPSLLTGRYPSRLPLLGLRGWFGVQVETVLTLPQRLQRRGYQTLGFHSNPFLSRVFGYHHGFHHFYDDLVLGEVQLPRRLRLLLNRAQRMSRLHPYLPAAALNRRVLETWAGAREPFFLWVHYMDTHGPYGSARRWDLGRKIRAERLWFKATRFPTMITPRERQELLAAYQGRVAYLDQHLGALVETLGRKENWERTLLIVTADHGDEFGEHGGYTHSHKLYDELIRVPLLIRGPGVRPQVVTRLVELVQLVPTILDWVGAPPGAAGELDGQSLRPCLVGRSGYDVKPGYSEAELVPHYLGCVRTDEWKFVCDEKTGAHRLYHLPSDPDERRNMAERYPEMTAKLLGLLNLHRAGTNVSLPLESLSRREEALVEARLRDLGYL